MSMPRNLGAALVVMGAPVVLASAVWFVWYPIVGYGTASRVAAQLAFFFVAALLMAPLRLRWRDVGLGPRRLVWAIVAALVAFGAVMSSAWLANAVVGTEYTVLRPSYRVWPFADAFLLTALGEELLFAGVTYRVLRRVLGQMKPIWSVALTAVAFAAMHVPGYLAMEYSTTQVLGRIGLNFVSWLVFGGVYATSGNLWSAVVTHAATDHGLTPLITSEPLFGLAFMAAMVAMSLLERRSRRSDARRRAGSAFEDLGLGRLQAGSAIRR